MIQLLKWMLCVSIGVGVVALIFGEAAMLQWIVQDYKAGIVRDVVAAMKEAPR